MLKIRKDRIVFELFQWKKKERKKEERRRKKMNKIGALQVWFSLVFSTLLKVRGTFRVGLALE